MRRQGQWGGGGHTGRWGKSWDPEITEKEGKQVPSFSEETPRS